jgi:cytochrome P450
MRTFCLLMGEEDEGFDLLDKARRSGSPSPQRMDEAAVKEREALMEPLREFCRKRLLARRGNPGEDLASDIANATIDGELIDEDEAVSMLTLVYVAGHGTTTSGMQGALICVGRHSQAQDMLRANPAKIPAAIEESLRLETPLHTLPRYCVAPTKLGGRDVKAGDQVYPVFGAANVDAELFPNPGAFDIDRKPAHFSFGRGIHACAGAPLARTQIRVLLEELLARTESFSVAEPLQRMPWPNNRCLSLPMVLRAAWARGIPGGLLRRFPQLFREHREDTICMLPKVGNTSRPRLVSSSPAWMGAQRGSCMACRRRDTVSKASE